MPRRDWMPCTSPHQSDFDRAWRRFIEELQDAGKSKMRDYLPQHYKKQTKNISKSQKT